MFVSDAKREANLRNAQLSSGPKTEEGKARSRGNALKHGLTGAGVVLPEVDAAEVERRAAVFAEELGGEGEVGLALARRAALNSVRMERAADQQVAALAERIRQVEADFRAPEGLDEAEADRLRSEAARIAMLDPSKEATLARRYEVGAERAFFRCLNELRRMRRQAEVGRAEKLDAMVGSFLAAREAESREDAEFDAIYGDLDGAMPRLSAHPAHSPATDGEGVIGASASRRR